MLTILFSRTSMEGDSFVYFAMRLKFEIIRLRYGFRRHSRTKRKRYEHNSLFHSLSGGDSVTGLLANNPFQSVPPSQEWQSMHRPLFCGTESPKTRNA